jgi:hypothetical protein
MYLTEKVCAKAWTFPYVHSRLMDYQLTDMAAGRRQFFLPDWAG